MDSATMIGPSLMDAPDDFASLLKKTRVLRRMSQAELGALIGVQQATISAWETGKQLPSAEDTGRIQKIAEFLSLTIDDLLRVIAREETAVSASHLLTESAYLAEQQEYLIEIGQSKAEIWLLGPETLPFIASVQVRDIWQENLAKGCRYNIIWFCDLVSRDTSDLLAPLLLQVGSAETARPDTSISHYVTSANHDLNDAEAKKIIKKFEDLQGPGNLPGNDIHLVGVGTNSNQSIKLDAQLVNRLLRFYNSYGTIVVYLPQSEAVAPLASMSLSSIRIHRLLPPKRLFFFMDDATSRHLARLVRDFKTAIKDKEKKS